MVNIKQTLSMSNSLQIETDGPVLRHPEDALEEVSPAK